MANGGDHSDEESCCSDEGQVKQVEPPREEDTQSRAASRQSARSSKSTKSNRKASQASFASLSSSRSGSGRGYSENLPKFLKDRVKVTFVFPLESRHECPSCDEVVRYPIVFEECGHRVCAHCFDTKIKRICPVDDKAIDPYEAYPDEKLSEEVCCLPVKCLTPEWCNWEGEFHAILGHMEVCLYAEVSCSNDCGAIFQRKETQKHMDKICPKKIISCAYCDERYLRNDQKEHMQECLKLPLPCPNKCDKAIQIPREELDKHIEDQCPKSKIPCSYEDIGCKDTYRRDALEKHYKNGIVNHVKLIYDLAMENNNRMKDHDTTLDKHGEMIEEANKRIGYLERIAHNSIIWRVDNYARLKKEGETVSSPTFYTSKHGYRLCAMTCLSGDGKGRGTHVSVFVSILKGAYDGLLRWPFDYEMDITLLDQDECQCKNHLKYCLKPNPCPENAPFLGRPRAQKNASFGCSKFISHEEAEGKKFIKDDALFIKVMVKCDAESEP